MPDETTASEAPRPLKPPAEVVARIRAAFMRVLDAAVPAYEVGQLNLFHDEDEKFIRDEVDRKLYEPQLPNGGQKERRMIERLKKLAEEKDWDGHKQAWAAIHAWEQTLPPGDPRNAGRYYECKPLTPKVDKKRFDWLLTLRESAHSNKLWDKKWFAQMLLAGLPEAVSNFEMECLFLLRNTDGSVVRLVRLRNVMGETSRGPHHLGSDILDPEAFASPEKFRRWSLGRGNFAFSGNQTALQKLHEDISRWGTRRVINQVDSCGWHQIKKTRK